MKSFLTLLPAVLVACTSSADIERINERLAKIDSTTKGIRSEVFFMAPRTEYSLADVDRDSKTVGQLTTSTAIGRGDRIFLGDDMWDVKYVKVFASQPDSAKWASLNSVELLVSYAGKARDAKPSTP